MKNLLLEPSNLVPSREALQGSLPLAMLGITLTIAPCVRADDECGIAGGSTEVICDSSGNPYQNITYHTATGLTLRLEAGVVAEDVSLVNDTVRLEGSGSGLLRVEVAEGATVVANGPYMHGVKVDAIGGSTSDIEIDVFGDLRFDSHKLASDLVVSAGAGGFVHAGATGNITITQHAGSEIIANGFDAGGLTAIHSGDGNTTITTAGRIVVTDSEEAAGADAWGYPTATGNILVEQLATGSIDTTGYKSAGLAGGTLGSGAVTMRAAGSITTHGDSSHGLHTWMLAPTTIGQATAQLLAGGNVLTEGTGSHGMFVQNPGLGAGIAQSAGTIRTQGDFSNGVNLEADAINAAAMQAQLSGKALVATSGADSHGVRLSHAGTGAASVALLDSARIQTTGDNAHGVDISAGAGGATLLQQTGSSITTAGAVATGIEMNSAGDVQARLAGSVSTSGAGSYGVALNTTAGTVTAELQDTSRIATSGNLALGLAITSAGDVTVGQAAGAGIASQGEHAHGVAIWADGNVSAELEGTVAADGELANAVLALSYTSGVRVDLGTQARVSASGPASKALVIESQLDAAADLAGTVSVLGDQGVGVMVRSQAGAVRVEMDAATAVSAQGDAAMGLQLLSQGDLTLNAAGTVSAAGSNASALSVDALLDAEAALAGTLRAEGQGATGALLRSQTGGVNVGIGSGANISGGSGAGTGLLLSSATAGAVLNAGSITAASDRALTATGAALAIDNAGAITGFVQLANAAGNRFTNAASGVLDLRHFADTDADGQRDTRRVAISDFGAADAEFINLGTVRLGAITGTPTVDATGYYAPTTGIDNRSLGSTPSASRVQQAQLVSLGSFQHRGVIDLRGNAIGNTLVITSNAQAGGAPGTATFVANGGELHLNATFDDSVVGGGHADMLVVDRTALGSAPTSIHLGIAPAALVGATQGNGIQLVEVRDKSASAAGVFALAQQTSGGLYRYSLRHNGVGADAADGNWYLRNTIADPANPGAEYPDYRSSVPTLVMLQAQAARLGLDSLGTYHDRLGRHDATGSPGESDQRYTTWGRWFGSSRGFAQRGNGMAEQDEQFRAHGPSYNHHSFGVQLGQVLVVRPTDSGATHAFGLHGGFAKARSQVSAVYGGDSGTSRLESLSGGLYWTYRTQRGAYVDAVLQASRHEAQAVLRGQAARIENNGKGYAASVEGGAPRHLRGGWIIEPQVQLVYQHVGFDHTRDTHAEIRHEDTGAINGRLGARLARSWANPSGKVRTAWLRANAWHDFDRQSTARVGTIGAGGADAVGLRADLGGTHGQLQLALSGELDENFSGFLSADYNFALDGRGNDGTAWRLGLRRLW